MRNSVKVLTIGNSFTDSLAEFFPKAATQRGVVLEITQVECNAFLGKKFRKGVTFLGCFCDSQWWREVVFLEKVRQGCNALRYFF